VLPSATGGEASADKSAGRKDGYKAMALRAKGKLESFGRLRRRACGSKVKKIKNAFGIWPFKK
jgi:hypothetical protein